MYLNFSFPFPLELQRWDRVCSIRVNLYNTVIVNCSNYLIIFSSIDVRFFRTRRRKGFECLLRLTVSRREENRFLSSTNTSFFSFFFSEKYAIFVR